MGRCKYESSVSRSNSCRERARLRRYQAMSASRSSPVPTLAIKSPPARRVERGRLRPATRRAKGQTARHRRARRQLGSGAVRRIFVLAALRLRCQFRERCLKLLHGPRADKASDPRPLRRLSTAVGPDCREARSRMDAASPLRPECARKHAANRQAGLRQRERDHRAAAWCAVLAAAADDHDVFAAVEFVDRGGGVPGGRQRGFP